MPHYGCGGRGHGGDCGDEIDITGSIYKVTSGMKQSTRSNKTDLTLQND